MDRTLSQAQVISRGEASSSKTRRGICSSRRLKAREPLASGSEASAKAGSFGDRSHLWQARYLANEAWEQG